MAKSRLVGGSRLENVLDTYAERSVRSKSVESVIEELHKQGIESLEDLVARRLEDFTSGGDVAKETFIYTQFIYTKSRVIDAELLDFIENKIAERS